MMRKTLTYKEMTDPMVRPRYTGIATFMRVPFSEDWGELDIALVGVPFDGGVTTGAGRVMAREKSATNQASYGA